MIGLATQPLLDIRRLYIGKMCISSLFSLVSVQYACSQLFAFMVHVTQLAICHVIGDIPPI